MSLVSLIFAVTVLVGLITGLAEGSRVNLAWGLGGAVMGSIVGWLAIPAALLPQVCAATLFRKLRGQTESEIDDMASPDGRLPLTAKLLVFCTAFAILAGPVLAWLVTRRLVRWIVT